MSILISLAMPGIGWLVAVMGLTVTALLSPFIGKTYVVISLAASVIHALTLGPLSVVGQSGTNLSQLPPSFLIGLVIAPVALAGYFISRPAKRPKLE
jgi:hypothetical protein